MDSTDDDQQMLEGREISSTQVPLQSPRTVGRSTNGSMLSTDLPGPNTLDGLVDDLRYSTPNSDNEPIFTSSRRLKDPSRESSVLANNVAAHLSIDTPARDAQDDSIDELDEGEHELPAPYLSSLPTGFCYDVRMRYHCELDPPDQKRDYHPEDPRRIFKIYKELCVAGLIKDDMLSTGALIPNPLVRIPVRDVTEAEVCLVHDKKHFDFMRSTSRTFGAFRIPLIVADADVKDFPEMTPEELVLLEKEFDSVYFNTVTFQCALLSAGGAIETCRAVASGQVKNAIAIVRPPGHHAECNRPMGFCMFDNVSIAAKVSQLDHADACRKVLILDWYAFRAQASKRAG